MSWVLDTVFGMTQLVEDPATPAHEKRPRFVWTFAAVAVVFFLIGMAGFSYEAKLGSVQKNDNSAFLPSSADSTKVSNQSEKFDKIQTIPGFIVYERESGLTPADKQKIDSDVARFRSVSGVAADQVGQPVFKSTVASISVPLVGKNGNKSANGNELTKTENDVLAIARANVPAGLVVHSAGAGGLLVAFIDAFNGLDGTLLFAAGGVVILILLVVYRSPVLWFYPLFSAGLALGAAALVIYPLAKHGTITLNGQSQGILSVLVIGAGTDYALLLISRYREELHEHQDRVKAMIAAWRGAAPPIAASAITVMLGLMCLTLADLNSTKGLGPVCAIGILCTVSIMLTVLPVLLVISGRWIFWPRRPQVDHKTDIATTHAAWSKFAHALGRHHRKAWVGASVVLIACILAITGLKTGGLSTVDGFTTKPDAIVGQHIYDKYFSVGAGAPAIILTSADKADAVTAAVEKVPGVVPGTVCVQVDYSKIAKLLAADPGLAAKAGSFAGCAPAALQIQPVDGKTLVNATLAYTYDSPKAYRTIERIRSAVKAIPGASALVGGESAINLDVQTASRHDRNLIIPVVLLVILIVLGVVLRSLIAPVILIVTVVLSFAATLGVSALAFNHIFHYANSDPAFPLFAFIFLVALGIDYNIFLMTRIREETLQHGTREGILRGLAVTGGVITSAGVVLAATFVVLGVLPIVFLAEIGFAVAFGVLLDTILVRSILVPALSHDLGRIIWWPSKLSHSKA
jgi:putative drug exporter of the RND superfamily